MNRYQYHDSRGEHLHTLDGQPLIGTSQVGNVLAKPLTWWASGLAVQTFGVPDPKVLTKMKRNKATEEEVWTLDASLDSFLRTLKQMNLADYTALVTAAYRAHDVNMREKAKGGTELHAEVERFVKDRMGHVFEQGTLISILGYDERIDPFIRWADQNVLRFLWSEGHCYSEKMWTGGISDIGYEDRNGKFGIIDIKSSREAYIGQFWQCAGYDLAISENGVLDANGNVLYSLEKPIDLYCIFAFGATPPQPFFFHDPADAQEGFLAELCIYKKLPQD